MLHLFRTAKFASWSSQQIAKRRQIDDVHVLAGLSLLGRLENHRVPAKAAVIDEQAKRLQAQAALADMPTRP
jgi:hypothetical protein